MTSEHEIITGCINGDRRAQKMLYERYASKMLGVCLRYMKNLDEAEDVLQDGFIKVFTYIVQYRFEGSFEGWLRRIMINTALNAYRSNLKHHFHSDIDEQQNYLPDNVSEDAYSKLSVEELLKVIQSLPNGYRMVFNLYEIEGYKHKEIGAMLKISENTSKTQLLKSKIAIRNKLAKLVKK